MPPTRKVRFQCGKNVIDIPFLDEYAAEIKAGTPVIRRIYVHENHAHLLKIDAQAGDRNNETFDLYTESDPPKSTKTGTVNIKYRCDLCKKEVNFPAVIGGIAKEETKDAMDVPGIEKHYQCVHIHNKGTERHAFHIRIDSQGKIFFAKAVKLALN